MVIRVEQGKGHYAIPTIRDRVVQTAVKLVIEPIFEADLYERAYSYRPGRGGAEAIKEVHRLIVERLARRPGNGRSGRQLREKITPARAGVTSAAVAVSLSCCFWRLRRFTSSSS